MRWETPISNVIDGKKAIKKEYTQWLGMMARTKSNAKNYFDVSLSKNFESFDYWCDWATKQKGFMNVEPSGIVWAIDKDILGNGKLYSEDVCVFVPTEINNLCKRSNNGFLKGVTKDSWKKRYRAHAVFNGVHISLGYYDTEYEAHCVYLDARRKQVDMLLEKYGKQLDCRIAPALYDTCLPDIRLIQN